MTKTMQILRNRNLAILCGEMPTTVAACQCEHLDHDDKAEGKHEVGALFDLERMIEIITIFGPYLVCRDCARGCHGEEVE